MLYPERSGNKVNVNTQNIPLDIDATQGNAFCFTAEGGGENRDVSYYTLFRDDLKAQRAFGDFMTDGTLALIGRNNEKYDVAVLRNGTGLSESNGKSIVKSKSVIPDLGIRWNGDEICLESSKRIVKYSLEGIESVDNTVNIAKGKDAQGSEHYRSNPPAHAIDGNDDTSWSAVWTDGSENPWLSVDLKDRFEISKIRITDNRQGVVYKVMYSDDGLRWNEADIENSTVVLENGKAVKELQIAPVAARHVKLLSNQGLSLIVYELEVYTAGEDRVSLYDLSIYAPDRISAVYVNGERTAFTKVDDFAVFDGRTEGGSSSTPGGDHNNTGGGSGGGSSHGSGGNVKGTIPIPVPTPAPTHEDIPKLPTDSFAQELNGYWAENEIKSLIEDGIVKGNSNGTLDLEIPVTRAEFVTLLICTLGIAPKTYSNEFKDVSADAWYADNIAAAAEHGLIEGYDGYAAPQDKITREEMAKILVSAYQSEHLDWNIPIDGVSKYTDQDEISSWAAPYVAAATELGILTGMEDGSFRPKEPVIRGQSFVVMYRLINQE